LLVDGVKCSKLMHLKYFTLNAAKNFINSFPNTSSQLNLGGAKVTLGGALPLLAPPSIRLWCILLLNHIVYSYNFAELGSFSVTVTVTITGRQWYFINLLYYISRGRITTSYYRVGFSICLFISALLKLI